MFYLSGRVNLDKEFKLVDLNLFSNNDHNYFQKREVNELKPLYLLKTLNTS